MKYEIKGEGISAFIGAANALSSGNKVDDAQRRALNHTGKKAFTRVKRALAKQVGLPVGKVVKLGGLRTKSANYSSIEYIIYSSGGTLGLNHFGAKQFKSGVRFRAWGKSHFIKSAFIYAGSSKSGKEIAYGHVFTNTRGFSAKSNRNNAIEKKFGPSIPKEMMKDESRKAFEDVAKDLPSRMAHELARITKGAVT